LSWTNMPQVGQRRSFADFFLAAIEHFPGWKDQVYSAAETMRATTS